MNWGHFWLDLTEELPSDGVAAHTMSLGSFDVPPVCAPPAPARYRGSTSSGGAVAPLLSHGRPARAACCPKTWHNVHASTHVVHRATLLTDRRLCSSAVTGARMRVSQSAGLLRSRHF